MPNLTYLDERPVFDLERAAVTGWVSGGSEGEQAARTEYQQRQQQKDRESMQYFRDWKKKIKAERDAAAREVIIFIHTNNK